MYEPRIVTNSGVGGAPVTWNASVPMPNRWKYRSKGVGGSARFGANQQEAFERFRDQLVVIKLIILESEWNALRSQLEWAQKSGQAFTFRFDKNTVGTEYSVFLDSPSQGDELAPEPAQGTVFAFELELTLRSATGTAFDVRITNI